jgi:hypothetical protein
MCADSSQLALHDDSRNPGAVRIVIGDQDVRFVLCGVNNWGIVSRILLNFTRVGQSSPVGYSYLNSTHFSKVDIKTVDEIMNPLTF